MNAITPPPFATPQANRLVAFFPNADAEVVSALSTQLQALSRYLVQIHELTLAETVEAIEAFFHDGRIIQATADQT